MTEFLQRGPQLTSIDFQFDMNRGCEGCKSAIQDHLRHTHKGVKRAEFFWGEHQIETGEYITALLGSSVHWNLNGLNIIRGVFNDYNHL